MRAIGTTAKTYKSIEHFANQCCPTCKRPRFASKMAAAEYLIDLGARVSGNLQKARKKMATKRKAGKKVGK